MEFSLRDETLHSQSWLAVPGQIETSIVCVVWIKQSGRQWEKMWRNVPLKPDLDAFKRQRAHRKHLHLFFFWPCLAFCWCSHNCKLQSVWGAEWPSLWRVGDLCVTLQTFFSHQHQQIPSRKGRAGVNPCFLISHLPVPVVISECNLKALSRSLFRAAVELWPLH